MANEHILYAVRLPYVETVDLSAARRWLAAIWQALPRSVWRRLLGDQRHVSLELVGTGDGVRYLIGLPSHLLFESVADQLAAHFPGAVLEPIADDYFGPTRVTATIELGSARTYDQSLLVARTNEADPLAGVLASLRGIEAGRLAAVQILIRPAVVKDLAVPSFELVARILAQDVSVIGARLQCLRTLSAFGPFAAENRLRPLHRVSASRRRMYAFRRRSWPRIRWHIPIISLDELATLYHFPSHAESLAHGVAMAATPQLSLRAVPPPEGILIGRAHHRGRPVDLRVQARDLLRHTMVLAATGGGKSTFLANLGLDLARQGIGFTLLDPHGELVRTLAEHLPEERFADVVLLKFADPEYPVGLNLLRSSGGGDYLIAEELVEIVRRVYAGSYWGPLLETVLRHAAIAVAASGGTLVDMARLLDDDLFRETLLAQVKNPETVRFWEAFGQLPFGSQERRAASSALRLQRFLANPLMRNIVGQRDTRFDPRTAMDHGQIVLLDLSGIGVADAKLLGSMLTVLYYQAALSRESLPPDQRRPHLLIMDECAWFVSATIADMADQVRKFSLGLCMASQRLSQIKPDEVRDAMFANFANLICFGLGEHSEAGYVARHLNAPGLGADELRRLPPFQGYAQVLLGGRPSGAFSLESLGPPSGVPRSGRWDELLAASRVSYARPRHVVEAQLAEPELGLAALPPSPEIRLLGREEGATPRLLDAAQRER